MKRFDVLIWVGVSWVGLGHTAVADVVRHVFTEDEAYRIASSITSVSGQKNDQISNEWSECSQSNATGPGMQQCIDNAYANYDFAMNVAYKKIMQSKDVSDGTKALVKQAQIKWLAFRDAEFKAVDNGYLSGDVGSDDYINAKTHMALLVRKRIEDLLLYEIPCPVCD